MAAAKGTTNWFAIIITTVVVVALVGVGFFVVNMNKKATDPGTPPTSSIVDPETGAVSFGSGSDVVETWVDFLCPGCGAFEAQWGEPLQAAAANGDITLKVHPVAILDRASAGTEYSSRTANAMYCVVDDNPDAGLPFLNVLFANQPEEGQETHDDATLKAFAEQSGAPGAAACIDDGTYKKFVQSMTSNIPAGPDGRSVTPTVVVNGEYVTVDQRQAVLGPLVGAPN